MVAMTPYEALMELVAIQWTMVVLCHRVLSHAVLEIRAIIVWSTRASCHPAILRLVDPVLGAFESCTDVDSTALYDQASEMVPLCCPAVNEALRE